MSLLADLMRESLRRECTKEGIPVDVSSIDIDAMLGDGDAPLYDIVVVHTSLDPGADDGCPFCE